jgi:hypothetical protein
VSRESKWTPPQQSTDNTPGRQKFAVNANKTKKETANRASGAAVAMANPNAANKPTSSPIGPSGNRTSLSVLSKENPYGPDRQNALNQEKAAKLNFSTFLTPLLVG